MTNRKIEYWVIPPETDAEFVAHMEGVLDVYAQPYDPTRPTLCMDEQPNERVVLLSRQRLNTANGLTMSMNGPGQRVFSCLLNRWRVGGR